MKNYSGLMAFCLLLTLVVGCGMLKNNIKRASSNFSPYKGKLSELLQPEISSSLVKFKLVGTEDADTYPGATEAKAFTYMQEGAGVSVKVDGALANYPTAAQAEAAIAELAGKNKGTLTKKSGGQRFVTPDGNTVVWTHGSLLCIVTSGFARPATNFEEAAPF